MLNATEAKQELYPDDDGFVGINRMLELVFPDPASRPTVRWVRERTKRREIEFVKIGRLVFFHPETVRQSLLERHTIRRRALR